MTQVLPYEARFQNWSVFTIKEAGAANRPGLREPLRCGARMLHLLFFIIKLVCAILLLPLCFRCFRTSLRASFHQSFRARAIAEAPGHASPEKQKREVTPLKRRWDELIEAMGEDKSHKKLFAIPGFNWYKDKSLINGTTYDSESIYATATKYFLLDDVVSEKAQLAFNLGRISHLKDLIKEVNEKAEIPDHPEVEETIDSTNKYEKMLLLLLERELSNKSEPLSPLIKELKNSKRLSNYLETASLSSLFEKHSCTTREQILDCFLAKKIGNTPISCNPYLRTKMLVIDGRAYSSFTVRLFIQDFPEEILIQGLKDLITEQGGTIPTDVDWETLARALADALAKKSADERNQFFLDVQISGCAALGRIHYYLDIYLLEQILQNLSKEELIQTIERKNLNGKPFIVTALRSGVKIDGKSYTFKALQQFTGLSLSHSAARVILENTLDALNVEYFTADTPKALLDKLCSALAKKSLSEQKIDSQASSTLLEAIVPDFPKSSSEEVSTWELYSADMLLTPILTKTDYEKAPQITIDQAQGCITIGEYHFYNNKEFIRISPHLSQLVQKGREL